jgi:hypothetical protein
MGTSGVATQTLRNATALTVTFDTNTLDAVVWPESAQLQNENSGRVVQAAIRAGRISGFFSETLITLEGIMNDERAQILGQSRVVVAISARGQNPGGAIGFDLSVGSHHVRNPLHPKTEARLQAALALGLRPLRTAATFTDYHLDPLICPTFEPDGGMPELIQCMDKVNAMTTDISVRGVGRDVAGKLGTRFTARDQVRKPELWIQSLGRARDKAEKVQVAAAVREWADGDSIAAHYGFGIQLFCTEDFAKTAGGTSVLDPDHRTWLSESFGIAFVTLAELAHMIGN